MIVYFRRTGVDRRAWPTLVAPAVTVVLVTGALVLVLLNFKTLIGGSGTTAAWLIATAPAAFIIGVAMNRGGRRPVGEPALESDLPG